MSTEVMSAAVEALDLDADIWTAPDRNDYLTALAVRSEDAYAEAHRVDEAWSCVSLRFPIDGVMRAWSYRDDDPMDAARELESAAETLLEVAERPRGDEDDES